MAQALELFDLTFLLELSLKLHYALLLGDGLLLGLPYLLYILNTGRMPTLLQQEVHGVVCCVLLPSNGLATFFLHRKVRKLSADNKNSDGLNCVVILCVVQRHSKGPLIREELNKSFSETKAK